MYARICLALKMIASSVITSEFITPIHYCLDSRIVDQRSLSALDVTPMNRTNIVTQWQALPVNKLKTMASLASEQIKVVETGLEIFLI